MVKRTKAIQKKFWIDAQQNKNFLEAFHRSGCRTQTQFFQKLLEEKQILVVDLEPFRQLYTELNRIGVNINQMTKACNAGEPILINRLEKISKVLTEMEDRLFKIETVLR